MINVKVRISAKLLQRLAHVVDSHSTKKCELTMSEAVRMMMRQWRRCDRPIVTASPDYIGDENTVTSFEMAGWMSNIPSGQIARVIEWGLDRPCNQPAPRLDIGGDPFCWDQQNGMRHAVECEGNHGE